MRTLQLINGTIIVIRQIAAVGPIINKEVEVDDDESESPLPPKRWCYFDIWLVGGSKIYPAIEYHFDAVQAERDRNKIVAALEIRVNEL